MAGRRMERSRVRRRLARSKRARDGLCALRRDATRPRRGRGRRSDTSLDSGGRRDEHQKRASQHVFDPSRKPRPRLRARRLQSVGRDARVSERSGRSLSHRLRVPRPPPASFLQFTGVAPPARSDGAGGHPQGTTNVRLDPGRVEDLETLIVTQRAVIADLGDKLRVLNDRADACEAERDGLRRMLARVGETLTAERRSRSRADPDPNSRRRRHHRRRGGSDDAARDETNVSADAFSPTDSTDPTVPSSEGDGWSSSPADAPARREGWLVRPSDVVVLSPSNATASDALGEGSSGFILRGRWCGQMVAVKRVRVDDATRAASFLREVSVSARLRHPNVLPFTARASLRRTRATRT